MSLALPVFSFFCAHTRVREKEGEEGDRITGVGGAGSPTPPPPSSSASEFHVTRISTSTPTSKKVERPPVLMSAGREKNLKCAAALGERGRHLLTHCQPAPCIFPVMQPPHFLLYRCHAKRKRGACGAPSRAKKRARSIPGDLFPLPSFLFLLLRNSQFAPSLPIFKSTLQKVRQVQIFLTNSHFIRFPCNGSV